MRSLVAACLLAASCAGGARGTREDPRIELPGEAWHVAYRLVLDDPGGPRIEGWAQITNSSGEDWSDAKLTLATRESRAHDLDADGLRDRVDLCPQDREDFDGYNDDDGCPDPDNDSDRILDVNDACPNDGEVYNGDDDDDGCPDRGRLVITNHGGGIVESIFFATSSDVVRPPALPVIDAMAATINGNPQLRLIEIGGHTDPTERDPWSLSLRRAAAVSKLLVARGVAPERLAIAPYAATQPLAAGRAAADLARSRRVGFDVLASDDDPPVAVSHAARPPFDPPPQQPVDDLRYDLAQPVSLKRGASARIAILDKPIAARALAMYEPTRDLADSAVHPFHAVVLVNTTGFVLQRGPLEVVEGGRVVVRGELRRTGTGETTRIRGELDRGATVTVARTAALQPHRILGVDGGELIVEDSAIETTRYTVAASRALAIELHHRRLPGLATPPLPAATVESTDRFIATREVVAGAPEIVDLVEPRPQRGRRRLTGRSADELAASLDRSKLPADVHDRLRAAIEPMRAIEVHRRDAIALRSRLAAMVGHATRSELDEIARAIGKTSEVLAREQTRLDELLRDLRHAPPPP